MRSKALALSFGLLIAALACPMVLTAQERAQRQVIVPLNEGGFVAFRSETAWADRDKSALKPQGARGEFEAKALVDEGHIIHRVLADKLGNFVFGYDLYVEPQPGARQFRIALSPLDARFADKLMGENPSAKPSLKTRPRISTLPQSAEPQVLDDGDSFALDLLVNQNTGVKIVDIVKVTFDRSTLWDTNPTTVPRDFSLDAVELTVRAYRLLINGEVMAVGKPSSDWSGALLWFYVSDRGRFIFSLVPRTGYQFQKVGIIENNRIEFTINGDRYEWISSAPVLPGGGTWNLWVLHDPTYTPLIDDPTTDPEKKKNKPSRIDVAVRKVEDKVAQILGPKENTFHPSAGTPDGSTAKRLRVIIGGADRIENLWPKH